MRKMLRAMFYSDGKFYPPYIYAFVFISIIVAAFLIRFISPLGETDKAKISDTLLLGLMTYSIALIGVSTWGKKVRETKDSKADINNAFNKLRDIENSIKPKIGVDTELHSD